MHYGQLYKTSVTDGEGIRISLYVSGCRNNCKGCHNPESHDFHFGHEYTKKVEDKIMELLRDPRVQGLTLCGGEPMEPENQRVLVELLKRVRTELPDKDIWCYTGYEFTDLINGGIRHVEVTTEMLSMIDVLVVGKFVVNLRDISDNNRWRGSRNQRVIDVKKTIAQGNIVLLEGIPNNK